MIDFTVVLKDQDNKPLQDMIAMQANGGIAIDLTLGRASSHALNVQTSDDQNLTGEDKFHRGALSFRIRDCEACELKAEEVVLIKRQLAKLYSSVVIYRAFPLLDSGVKNV